MYQLQSVPSLFHDLQDQRTFYIWLSFIILFMEFSLSTRRTP